MVDMDMLTRRIAQLHERVGDLARVDGAGHRLKFGTATVSGFETGWKPPATANVVLASPTGGLASIAGIVRSFWPHNSMLIIVNAGSSFDYINIVQSTLPSATSRIIVPGGTQSLEGQQVAMLFYDTINLRWRMIGNSTGGGWGLGSDIGAEPGAVMTWRNNVWGGERIENAILTDANCDVLVDSNGNVMMEA